LSFASPVGGEDILSNDSCQKRILTGGGYCCVPAAPLLRAFILQVITFPPAGHMQIHESIKAVVFDLDGLMFNTEDLYDEVGEALLRPCGHRFTTELKDAMTGRPARVALQIMIDHHGLDTTVEQLQAETDVIFPQLLQEKLAPMPGLLPLLDALEIASLPKAVATSSRRLHAARILNLSELASRFDFVLTAESVKEGKPHPEIYLTAASNFGAAPKEILVFEDSEIGCRSAVSAGATTVAVPGKHSSHHDFSGVRLIAESLADPRIFALLGIDCD